MNNAKANFSLAMNLYNQIKDAGFSVGKLEKQKYGKSGFESRYPNLYASIEECHGDNIIHFKKNNQEYELRTTLEEILEPYDYEKHYRQFEDNPRDVIGHKFSIKVINDTEGEIKSSSSKKLMEADISEDFIKSFADGKVVKMVESCEAREEKIQKKLLAKENAKQAKRDRCKGWHGTMRSAGVDTSDTWFLDGACTTMQVKIQPGDDDTIAKVVAAITGKTAEEVLTMFTLENIK